MASNKLDIQIAVNIETPNIGIGVNIENPDVGMDVDRHWKEVEMEINKGGEYVLPYDGPYDVNASFYYDRLLGTYGRKMTENVRVNKIPVLEVSNPQGGKTITIGV